ncbi:CorA metal ion transporter [Coemansia spiralis]|nr:CorA metal ion transporter [Coemansia spiralis]
MHPLGQGGLGTLHGAALGSADAQGPLSGHSPLGPQGRWGHGGALADQVSALQSENLRLRRANQALSATAAGENGVDDPGARRRQLVELLLSLIDPHVAPTDSEPALDSSPQQPPPPQRLPQPTRRSRPPSTSESVAQGRQCDWDCDALREIASQGMVAPVEASDDRYAAESRRAIGSGNSYMQGAHDDLPGSQLQHRRSWMHHRAPQELTRSGSDLASTGSFMSQKVQISEDDASEYDGAREQASTRRASWFAPPLRDDKLAALAASMLGHGPAPFAHDPSARFILHSPAAGTFQAPTLDALRSGNMTLADIIEASAKSMSLDQLQRCRIAEAELAAGDANEDGSGDDGLQMAAGSLDGERRHFPPSDPAATAAASAPSHGGGGCFWLDITDPTPGEMASLARVFGIHPLTVEDILAEEDGRDKCEMFGGYCFLAYRTIDYGEDAQSNYEFNRGNEGIATASFAVVVKQSCVLTFHRARELGHVPAVIDRLRGLAPAAVTPAYIAYALVDDITDTLGPEMRSVELEVDAVDELVLILSTNEQADMLQRIGAARRKILTLWRLLQGKPDVIRAFSRLMERQAAADEIRAATLDEPAPGGPLRESRSSTMLGGSPAPLPRNTHSATAIQQLAGRTRAAALWPACVTGGHGRDKQRLSARPSTADLGALDKGDAEGPVTADEVAHYLSDVYDHLVSLVGSSSHCDMVLSRAHSNYLARLSLGLGESTMGTNQLATQMTVIAGIFLPLTLVAGLLGMNLPIPGQHREDTRDFWLIVGTMIVCVIITLGICRWRRVI